MVTLAARFELDLPSRTLKEKRRIIKSLMARARQTFNVAAAEVDLQEVPGAASLAFATVSPSRGYAHGLIDRLEEWIERERPDVRVVVVEREEL